VHAFAALAAFLLGAGQILAPKGNTAHRVAGWLWVALMTTVCASAFLIHQIRLWGPYSPIHLLAIFVLVMLPLGVGHARAHRVVHHRRTMLWMFAGALLIAGAFTFVPGRIMHDVLFRS
jgi:uncharacterized membrane protein